MIETTSHQLKPITISHQVRIVNPAILKVIANTIRQSVEGDTLTMKLRILFLDDLIRLFQSAHENRKIMLQQSVWQDWLLALGSLKPTTDDEYECQEKVYKLLNILLHHSIKWEWGGWRVWVDTMALIHSSVARCNHKENLDMLYARDEEVEESEETDNAKEDEPRDDQVKESEEKVSKTVNKDEPPTYSECEGEKFEAEAKQKETLEEISEDAPSPKPEDSETQEEVSVDQVEPVIEETPDESEKPEEVEDETQKESETHEDNTKTEEKAEESSETTPDTTTDTTQETTEDKTEEKPEEAEIEAEDEPEGISKELAAQLSLQDDELEENREGNDSETVEVGSNDEEDKMTSHEAKRRSLSPTEELSATKISEISENSSNPPPPTTNGMNWSPAPRTPGAFRIPDFRWSPQHYRILTELLDALDDDLKCLRHDENLLTSVENQILLHNILHLASQLADNLIIATGGVLPILASATSPTFELDIVEPSQGLNLNESWFLLDRLMIIIDLTLNVNQNQYPNVISISEIENEKAMQNGGILRPVFKLSSMSSM